MRALAIATLVITAAMPGRDGAALAQEAPDRTRAPKKVLVIGIDGVRPDVLAEVATPHLDRLAAEGAFSANAQTGRPTVSGPGWSSLLTGVWPAKHGVVNNEFTGKRYDLYPDFLTRIERAHPDRDTFAAIDWLPLAADSAGGPIIGDEPDTKYIFNGYALASWAAGDSAVVDAAVKHLRSRPSDAGFVYLGNPDEVSHEARSIGEEYRAAIALADRHVGMLLDAIRSRPDFAQEDWLVLVSTDHGRRTDGGHGGDSPEESTIFYIASGPATVRGTPARPPDIVDVAVTALAHAGLAIDPAWQLDGRIVGLRR
ncbi:MAG: alkaline phosphatase family protein [Gemmatimonadetes bacterium]|nr:alkaline phosphatase family protein [Gemmatimonadota bacterium]